jgi:hypothetical protein
MASRSHSLLPWHPHLLHHSFSSPEFPFWVPNAPFPQIVHAPKVWFNFLKLLQAQRTIAGDPLRLMCPKFIATVSAIRISNPETSSCRNQGIRSAREGRHQHRHRPQQPTTGPSSSSGIPRRHPFVIRPCSPRTRFIKSSPVLTREGAAAPDSDSTSMSIHPGHAYRMSDRTDNRESAPAWPQSGPRRMCANTRALHQQPWHSHQQ